MTRRRYCDLIRWLQDSSAHGLRKFRIDATDRIQDFLDFGSNLLALGYPYRICRLLVGSSLFGFAEEISAYKERSGYEADTSSGEARNRAYNAACERTGYSCEGCYSGKPASNTAKDLTGSRAAAEAGTEKPAEERRTGESTNPGEQSAAGGACAGDLLRYGIRDARKWSGIAAKRAAQAWRDGDTAAASGGEYRAAKSTAAQSAEIAQ